MADDDQDDRIIDLDIQPLSEREREVLELIAEGKSTPYVAKRLFISQATVRNHVQACLDKLGAHSRLEAVMIDRQFRADPASRLLRWCQREGITLVEWQRAAIRSAFGPPPDVEVKGRLRKAEILAQRGPPLIEQQPFDVTVTMSTQQDKGSHQ